MLDFTKIKAITLDLDDTLWPVWPTIGRAEEALAQWLAVNAPKTVPLCAIPGYQRKIREEMPALRPDLGQDLSALRREAIRVLLQRADENPHLAESAFDLAEFAFDLSEFDLAVLFVGLLFDRKLVVFLNYYPA